MLTASSEVVPGSRRPPAASVAELLRERLDASRNHDAICDGLDGGATWKWGEVIAAAVEVAAEFDAVGLCRGDRLAHVGPHGPDWIVVDLACSLSGIVHMPLHADASHAEHAEQLAWLRPRGLALSGPMAAGRPLPAAAAGGADPIVIDLRAGPVPTREPRRWRDGILRASCWRRRFDDVAGLRDRVRRLVEACDPDACGTILLSSGTSGRPKGVLHCQRAIVANATAAADVFLDEPRDVRLSWLPMSHALARTGDLVTALVRGGCLNVVTDRRRALDACGVLPPTVVLGVPAFFERLERAAETGRIPDLAAALGGRVRVCISGGAALRERTAAAFAVRGVPLVAGYGLAEAGPIVTVSTPRSSRPGTVGPALPGVELAIDDRPGSAGQLLVRTPSRAMVVIDGDDRPDARAADGGAIASRRGEWLETGDIATIDVDGHVRITGRLVDTLVLAGGEKVPPAAIEAMLAEDPAVAQVCVVGDGLGAPLALVVPEPTELRAAIRRMGVRVFSRRAALEHPRVVRWLARRLERRQWRLPRSWRVRRAFLVGRPFDERHGEATASLKLRRGLIAAHFAARIAAAAATRPPRWVAVLRGGPAAGHRVEPTRGRSRECLESALWRAIRARGGEGGFAAAAGKAVEPLPDAVASVVDRACHVLGRLRTEGRLYEPAPADSMDTAPLDDAPAKPQGKFTRDAEEEVGATGLWGLLVPERFGGAGCSMQQLARAITRLAATVPTAAGMLAVHSSIGAVSALDAFGTPEQQERHLPGLARGRPLSVFGATEPLAGCDLHAIHSRLERHDGRLLLTGTKMFITGATYGRAVKLLTLLDGRPVVTIVRLPDADTPSFRLRRYALHPLKHAHNAALEFTRFDVDESDVLAVPAGAKDGMPIVWHGLNRGRVTLAAQAAGTLRLLVAQARDHALARRTWGEPIASRELVQGRLARIAAGIAACDALASWAAAAIDAGHSGELEAIVAKVVASECVRTAAIDALGIHGGRAFLVGHPLGDSFHDHFAVTVYEGESDLLGLALLKGLCRHHPAAGLPDGWRRAAAWLAWRAGQLARPPARDDREILDRRLRDHAAAAWRLLDVAAARLDNAIRRHGRSLADRQLLAAAISAEIRDATSVLAVAHHADAVAAEVDLAAADCWCRLALARARGHRPSAADHEALAALGRAVVDRGAG